MVFNKPKISFIDCKLVTFVTTYILINKSDIKNWRRIDLISCQGQIVDFSLLENLVIVSLNEFFLIVQLKPVVKFTKSIKLTLNCSQQEVNIFKTCLLMRQKFQKNLLQLRLFRHSQNIHKNWDFAPFGIGSGIRSFIIWLVLTFAQLLLCRSLRISILTSVEKKGNR